MPRTAPTKQALNQCIRADIPGGDYLLDLLANLHDRRRDTARTDEYKNFLKFMHNRLKSIRARMREAVIDRQNGVSTDPTSVCKAIAEEVIQDLRKRIKDPRYCKRKQLKFDHLQACKDFRDWLLELVAALDGRVGGGEAAR
jgi:hypothetical protein